MAEYLGTVSLGGLYNNSAIQPRPTKPWRNDSAFGNGGTGNIPNMSGSMANYSLGDTPALEANKLMWHKIKDAGKTLLVCDRNILASVSWDDLNAEGLIFGKIITIDNKQYKARVLTGGNNFRSGTEVYSGGSPATNEWDRFITNEEVITGLPIPAATDLDSSIGDTDRLSAHNQFWNWGYFYSWAQETYISSASSRSNRGYGSARYWAYTTSTSRNASYGWRPVLEEVAVPEYLGAVNLGGLYKDSVIMARPTKPWINSTIPSGFGSAGDIPSISGSITTYSIGETPVLESNQLIWHKFKEGSKILLICDRSILSAVSWDALNSAGYIGGKIITLGGKRYLLRSLSGGISERLGTSILGGTMFNEWDSYVINELGILGVPAPQATDIDAAFNATDKNSVHNQFWNWAGIYNWCKDVNMTTSINRAIRGYTSARTISFGLSNSASNNLAWRPVLEELPSVPEYLGTVKLGGLYKDSVIQPRPTKPWDPSAIPTGFGSVGDIPLFSTLQDMTKWTIKETPALESNQLVWHKFKDDAKTLLICDRNILAGVSWEALKSAGYIDGKNIIIDNQPYFCRLISGGEDRRIPGFTTGTLGAFPNEWDTYVVNELGITGILSPQAMDMDSTLNVTDKNSIHNQLWNWAGIYSWAKEADASGYMYAPLRGLTSSVLYNPGDKSLAPSTAGWRPVLEILNASPTISGSNIDLGVQNSDFSLTYTVGDADLSDVLTVKEYINENLIKTITPANRNSTNIISIDVNALGLGVHVVKVEVSDGVASAVERIYTFNITAKRYTLTLDRPLTIFSGHTLTHKDIIVKSLQEELALTNVNGNVLTYEGDIEQSKANINITLKSTKAIKKIVYTVN